MSFEPSKQYEAAVAEGAKHHKNSKTYSGSLLRPHKPFLTNMIERLVCASALDYGCGKGVQYEWMDPKDGKTLEQAWGFPVAKYDPCWPPFAEEPEGKFDLVLCTHTLALVPFTDLNLVTMRLFELAIKGVFIAEKIGTRKKGEIADPHARAIGWQPNQWIGWVGGIASAFPDIETVLSLRTTEKRGKITTRYVWHGAQYLGAYEAKPTDDEGDD